MRLLEISLSPYQNRLLRAYRAKTGLSIEDFVALSDQERDELFAAIDGDKRFPAPKSDPGYYYHGTTKAAVLAIRTEGLTVDDRPSKWRLQSAVENSKNRIFFSHDLDIAERYAYRASHKQPILLRVRAEDLPAFHIDTEEEDSIYVETNVPANVIEIWTGRKWGAIA